MTKNEVLALLRAHKEELAERFRRDLSGSVWIGCAGRSRRRQ